MAVHIRRLNKEETAQWVKAIHKVCEREWVPALRAAYSHLMPFVDEDCKTAYTDCQYRIGLGPHLLDPEQTTLDQLATTILHETMHNTQHHRQRLYEKRGLNAKICNFAADLEINSLIAQGVHNINLKSDPTTRNGKWDRLIGEFVEVDAQMAEKLNAEKDENGKPLYGRTFKAGDYHYQGILLPRQGQFHDFPDNLTAEQYLGLLEVDVETMTMEQFMERMKEKAGGSNSPISGEGSDADAGNGGGDSEGQSGAGEGKDSSDGGDGGDGSQFGSFGAEGDQVGGNGGSGNASNSSSNGWDAGETNAFGSGNESGQSDPSASGTGTAGESGQGDPAGGASGEADAAGSESNSGTGSGAGAGAGSASGSGSSASAGNSQGSAPFGSGSGFGSGGGGNDNTSNNGSGIQGAGSGSSGSDEGTFDDGYGGEARDHGDGHVSVTHIYKRNDDGTRTEVGRDNLVDDLGKHADDEVWKEASRLGIDPISRSEEQKVRDQIAHDIEMERKSNGYGSGAGNMLLNYIERALRPPVIDWRRMLRKIVTRSCQEQSKGRTDYTFRKINRRYSQGDFIFPGMTTYVPTVRFALDTSGSMSADEYYHALSEAEGILKFVKAKIDFVCWDGGATKPIKIKDVKEMKNNLVGGGGTSPIVVFDEIEEEKPQDHPDVLIIATDGCFDWKEIELGLSKPVMKNIIPIILIVYKFDEDLYRNKQKEIIKQQKELRKFHKDVLVMQAWSK